MHNKITYFRAFLSKIDNLFFTIIAENYQITSTKLSEPLICMIEMIS